MRTILFALALVALASGARAETFYEGKTVTVITGLTGGYDTYARLLTRHMPKYLPGKPTMIVKSMPGAASMAAANHLYSVAAPDGLTFGTFARTIPMAPLIGDKAARFSPDKFTWIGSSSSFRDDAFVLLVQKSLDVRSIDDLRKRAEPVRFGSTGPSAPSDMGTRIIRDVLSLKLQLIRGYPGTDQTMLGVERGELDGIMIGISSLQSLRPAWLKPDGPFRFLLQYGYGGAGRHPMFPDVPRVDELVTSAADKDLFRFMEFPFRIARPFAGPPGIPAERTKLLRDAFLAAHEDAHYREEAAKIGLDVSAISGEEVERVVGEAAGYPDSLIARYSEILQKN